MEKLELDTDITIARAHTARKSKYGKKYQPRIIVCKLLYYKDKVKEMRSGKTLKGSDIYINKDFFETTLQYRKELWKEIKRYLKKKVRLFIFSIIEL